MSFVSPLFLSAFLPLVLLGCWVLHRVAWQNVLLAAFSLVFYAFGEPIYALLLLGSVAFDYGMGLYAAKAKRKAVPVALSAIFHVGLLCAFKYMSFLLTMLNSLAGLTLPVPTIALPIGISFFTFQGMSYLFDVCRGDCDAERSPLKLLLYISFFPQLVAGPIVRYQDIRAQMDERTLSIDRAAKGLRRLIVGLSKKVLLADTLGRIADAAFAQDSGALGLSLAWLGAMAFVLQLYLDFSGYTDMALGMGEMLGFTLLENFQEPYRAASLTDFWRRWHITLTNWFRSYVYIPLGGNRSGKVMTCRNLLTVFALTGLWHGASWTFVCWGLLNGLVIVLEKQGIIKPDRMPRALAHLYTLVIVVMGFVLFRADTLSRAAAYLGSMIGLNGVGAPLALRWLSPKNIACLLAALLLSLGTFRGRFDALESSSAWRWLGNGACALLLALCWLSIVSSGYHPFLYFRF